MTSLLPDTPFLGSAQRVALLIWILGGGWVWSSGFPVEVMARGGAAGQAPSHSRVALTRCVEDGFTWAMLDVAETRDGELVIVDSRRYEELGLGRRGVEGRTWSELMGKDAGGWFAGRYVGERVLTLKEALEIAGDSLRLCLRIRGVDPMKVRETLESSGALGKVLLLGPAEILHGVAGRAEVALMLEVGRKGLTRQVRRLAPRAVMLTPENDRPEILAEIRELGYRLFVDCSSCDQEAGWRRAQQMKPDGVLTDLPEEFVAWQYHQMVPRRRVSVSFHRGASRYAPENTLSAFAKACRLGADYVEFDVRTSRDGGLFLLHDGRLDRTTDGKGLLVEKTGAELGVLDAGSWFGRPFVGERLPTLAGFLSSLPPGVGLYFDAKAIAPEVLSTMLERHGMIDRTVVYQSVDYLSRLVGMNRRIRALPPLRRAEELEGLLARLKPYGVDVAWESLSAELIARCHSLGIQVFSDALGRNEQIDQYQRAIRWGIDVIQTDHPLRVYQAIALLEGRK